MYHLLEEGLKVYIWPKCFSRFSLSLKHLNMSSNSKKWIPMHFAIKSSFKFPASATPNEVDRVMIDWWRMTSLQEYLEALCFSFACLTTALLGRPTFVCFLSRKPPHHYWNVTTHSETQTLFCTDSRSTSLGVAEAGTLRLDLRALKSQNPIFFLEYLFTQYRATITIKTLLAV